MNKHKDQPHHCLECLNIIENDKKFNKFCNNSCAAIFNNKKRKKIKFCKCCHTQISRRNIFCSIKCQHEYSYQKTINDWLLLGGVIGVPTLKRYLKETFGEKCSVCSISEWNGKPIVLELEHKDGNYTNNKLDNVCLLCPNCHSQTDTYKSKNKGNGRHYRSVRRNEGKSF